MSTSQAITGSTEVDRKPINPRDLRSALGGFATGVTIVTTQCEEWGPVGLTVNSFSSVSLDPPLVLWSLSRHSPSLKAFQANSHFAINVLAADQQELSNRFAQPIPEKFRGVSWHGGIADLPLLEGCVATFECRTRHQVDGGDHVIFIGEVEEFAHRTVEPLLFLAGRYHKAQPLIQGG
ncbi:MAG: flavin reductase family protein [Aquisalimonadaceae bacterium]